MPEELGRKNFKELNLKHTYRTSSYRETGPVDILKEFYIPVLSSSVKYDRMAGYFTSSSLAVASQGFSTFTSHGGKLRLIVGSDISVDDIDAILEGDSERLAHKLSSELDNKDTWPQDTQRGVELLAWMIAKGYLEIRVAFRISQITGKPIAYNSTEDGYVHEKWAIFHDFEGNRILASGSLNESQRALQKNAENLDINADWWNDISKDKVDEAEEDFDLLWKNQVPYFRILTLPQAIKEKLIRIGKGVRIPTEIDGTEGEVKFPKPSSKEVLRFLLIKEGPKLPGGQYVGMETTPIDPWPHQDIVARRLIETWPYSHLLCDEVGLGKTIEAGLALRSLILSKRIKRVMIAAPAGLTHQWHREMATKFYLPFGRACTGSSPKHEYILPLKESRNSASLYAEDLTIISTNLMSQKQRKDSLKNASDFDVVLLDEAHYARRKDPAAKDGVRLDPEYGNVYKTIDGIVREKTQSLWLATATPMQLSWIEAFDLVRLTRRVGNFKEDPYIMNLYYQLLSALGNNAQLDKSEWDFLRQAVLALSRQDPYMDDYLRNNVFDIGFNSLIRRWLKQGKVPSGADLKRSRKVLFSAAPLSRVMQRHTRQLLKIYKEEGKLKANLAERRILPIPNLVFSPLEKQAYEDLEDYCKELKKQIEQYSSEAKKRASIGFYLSFLRLRFASSLFAIKQTLQRRHAKVVATLQLKLKHESPFDWSDFDQETDVPEERCLEEFLKDRTPEDLEWEKSRLEEMIEHLKDLTGTPAKIKKLFSVLNQRRDHDRIRQTVIFTRFTDTLNDLLKRLRSVDPTLRTGVYSGKYCAYYDVVSRKMTGANREEIKHLFLQGEVDILICTDAAAEGLNLQTADLLVNLDLPWNPMKVEQRIGRIDRIGQKFSEIFVLNLCYQNSAEEIVYGRLLKRIGEALNVVGTMPFSLLPVTEEDFRGLAEGEITSSELEKKALERLNLRQDQTASMEIPSEDLYQIYKKIQQNYQSPITLDNIWKALTTSQLLQELGSALVTMPEGEIFVLNGIRGIQDGTGLTTDRVLFEKGCPSFDGVLHFATYGDPIFDALMEFVLSDEHIPDSIRSIEVPLDSSSIATGIAVMSNKPGENVRLVTSWSDIEDLIINDSHAISEETIESFKYNLTEIARDKGPMLTTTINERISKENARFASAQQIFNLLLAHSLIRSMKTFGISEEDNFWQCIAEIDKQLEGKREHTLSDLPRDPLKMISDYLMLDLNVPQMGSSVSLQLPIHVVYGAIHAACREAAAMRTAKSELQIDSVLARIKRRITVLYKKNFKVDTFI